MLRDFYGAMNANLNYEAGYFITTGIFTLDAKQFAEDKPIELIDGAKLMDYVNVTPLKTTPQRAGATKQAAPSDIPVCPKSVQYGQRTAKKGNMAGSQFWGCSVSKCNK
jgi:restriction system protein